MHKLLYPDGEPCCVGDLIWFNEGLCVGRVADILTPERMRAELDAAWSGGHVLSINYGLGEQAWGELYCYDESRLADVGIRKLTSTEEMAVELLFRLLERQTGKSVWNNPEWNYVAWLEPTPLGEQRPGFDRVWNLAIVRQDKQDEVLSYRYDHSTRRFLPPNAPCKPIPPRRPEQEKRSFTTSKGQRYHEGDIVWVHGRLGVTSVLIRRIILPDDAEAEWIGAGGVLREPWVETTDLEREDGGTVEAVSHFEQECCGKLSPAEELAVDLLFHLLEQHPSYPMRASSIMRCGLSIKPAPPLPGERKPNWRYARARRRLSIFICNERDPMLGQFLCYRFKRGSCEFVPEMQG